MEHPKSICWSTDTMYWFFFPRTGFLLFFLIYEMENFRHSIHIYFAFWPSKKDDDKEMKWAWIKSLSVDPATEGKKKLSLIEFIWFTDEKVDARRKEKRWQQIFYAFVITAIYVCLLLPETKKCVVKDSLWSTRCQY